MGRRYSTGPLWIEYLPPAFWWWKAFKMSSMNEVTSQKTFYRGSMDGRPSTGLLWICEHRSSLYKRLSTDLLWIEELLEVFYEWKFYEWNTFHKTSMDRRPPTNRIRNGNRSQVFYGWNTFHRHSMDRRLSTCFLWIEYLLLVFWV